MITLLTAILAALVNFGKSAWSFIKAKALLLWAFGGMILPKIFELFRWYRLVRLATLAAVFYAVYTVVHDVINGLVVLVELDVTVTELISQAGWAGWLLWDGPMQIKVLVQQFISCVAFLQSLLVCAFMLTRIEWFTNSSMFSGGMGPRRS